MAKKSKAEKATGMVQIQTKVQGYNGVSAGILFRDGVGETNDSWRIQWFKDHGYVVSADNTDAVDAEEAPSEGEGDE